MTISYQPVRWLPEAGTAGNGARWTTGLAAVLAIVLALVVPHLTGSTHLSAPEAHTQDGETAKPDGRGKWTGYM